MTGSDKQKITAKLIEIYEQIDCIEKLGQNDIQHYKYVRSADVVRTVRNAFIEKKIYAEINFDFVGGDYTIARAKDPSAPFAAVNVKCSIVLHDQESGETVTASGLGTGADTSDKSVYKAQTGALKYALRHAELVPDVADPEADESVDEKPQQRPAARPVQTQRPTQAAKPVAAKASTATQTAKPTATPATPPKTSAASAAATSSTTTSATVAAPSTTMPTEAEMAVFRDKFDKLRINLCDKNKGNLKASTKPVIPVAVKLREFMCKTEGVKTPNDLTKEQWEDFFKRADRIIGLDNGWVGLAKLVNKANGIEEEKK